MVMKQYFILMLKESLELNKNRMTGMEEIGRI